MKCAADLLLLAKLDRSPDIELTEGDLNDLVREMEPQLRLLAGNRRVDLLFGLSARCRFDEDKMKQVVLKLFHNAVEHTDPEQGLQFGLKVWKEKEVPFMFGFLHFKNNIMISLQKPLLI